MTLFDGAQLTSEDLRGKVVVLNVWATWCPPCRVEIPALQRLHDETAADGDVVVLGLATDVQGARVVAPFLDERDVSYPNGLLDRETRRALGGITHTPTTFVIGPDGVVHHKVLGFFAPPAMRAAVSRLRREAGNPTTGAPSPATRLAVAAGDGQTGLDGVPLPDSLEVVVEGPGGPQPGLEVRWSALGAGRVRPAATRTDARGRARALWIPAAGADSVRASVEGGAVVFRGQADAAVDDTRFQGRNGYVEYRAGTLPVVVSVPHGGTLRPDEIPDRKAGTTVRDRGTDHLGFALADALEARTGRRPHLVVSRLHRTKLDPNREVGEAAAGDPLAEQAWEEYHRLVEHARSRVVATHRRGLYLDLHGHGHPIARVELGYLLDGDDLSRPDGDLDRGRRAAASSIRTLVADAGLPLSAVVRGPGALGSLLEDLAVPATPSDVQPSPGDHPFFGGGYSVARHGSRDGGPVSGIQIEVHHRGARDTRAARVAFAEALAEALEEYLARWY